MNRQETALKLVKVRRDRLMLKLAENLKMHEQEYAEALLAFKKRRAELLRNVSLAAQAADGLPDNDEARNKLSDAWHKYVALRPPKNHSDAYERAITVMDWIEEDMVELSMSDFQCYVEDNWEWQATFKLRNSSYA